MHLPKHQRRESQKEHLKECKNTDCEVLDAKIATKKAETDNATTGDAIFDQYVTF